MKAHKAGSIASMWKEDILFKDNTEHPKKTKKTLERKLLPSLLRSRHDLETISVTLEMFLINLSQLVES